MPGAHSILFSQQVSTVVLRTLRRSTRDLLDVHPPHHPTHTWKDFFIHIATIVVGLLIAVGLEQTVEWFHHRHQIHVTRERIQEETLLNRHILALNQQDMERMIAALNHDVEILRSAEGKDVSADALDFSWNLQGFYSAAYTSARDSSTLSLLPYKEEAMLSDLYLEESLANDAVFALIKQLDSAKAAAHVNHMHPQLTSSEITDMLKECSAALASAHYTEEHYTAYAPELDAMLRGDYRQDFGGHGQ